MTTLAVLADIHGNLPALELVLQDLDRFPVDRIVVAGDVINWGPFSRQVLERLSSLPHAVIRGNNEFYLLDYNTPRAPSDWSNHDQWQMLPWLNRQLRGPWRHAIAAWLDSLSSRFPDAPPVRVVHGTPISAWEGIYVDTDPALVETICANVEEQALIAGHTHIPTDCHIAGRHILNPGSVGVPLHGKLEACYMLLEGDARGWRPTFRRLPIDNEPVLREFERQRFADECGVIGQLVVDEFKTARLQVLPFLRWRAACRPVDPLTPALLDEFRAIDINTYTPVPYRNP